MFDLKRPCANCPFRRGQGKNFRLRRLGDIRRAPAFQCHKTVAGLGAPEGTAPQQCAGLLAVLWREGGEEALNQIAQVAFRLGVLDPGELDPDGEAYPDWRSATYAHAYGRDLLPVVPRKPEGAARPMHRMYPPRQRRLTAVPPK